MFGALEDAMLNAWPHVFRWPKRMTLATTYRLNILCVVPTSKRCWAISMASSASILRRVHKVESNTLESPLVVLLQALIISITSATHSRTSSSNRRSVSPSCAVACFWPNFRVFCCWCFTPNKFFVRLFIFCSSVEKMMFRGQNIKWMNWVYCLGWFLEHFVYSPNKVRMV